MFNTLKCGQRYLETWPLESRLALIFPENRIIKVTLFAKKLMPFVAVFSVTWQQIFAPQDKMAFAIAIMTGIFALLLPLQGLYWLGHRSKQPLSPQGSASFYQLSEQLKQLQEPVPLPKGQPTYQDLAELLQLASKKLDQGFWQQL